MSVSHHPPPKKRGPLNLIAKEFFERLLAAEHWSIRMEKSASHSSLKKHSMSNYLHFSVKIDQLFSFFLSFFRESFDWVASNPTSTNTEASVDFHKANRTKVLKRKRIWDLDQWFIAAMRATASSGLAAVSLR